MARQIPSSRTQDRIAALAGLDHDGTYQHAARVLDAAGLPADGMAGGMDARQIKKLSDDDLKALLPVVVPVVDVPTSTQLAADADRARRDAKAARKQRTKTNDRLRAHGYRWTRGVYVPTTADPSPLMDDYGAGAWVLLDPDGNQTTVDAALARING